MVTLLHSMSACESSSVCVFHCAGWERPCLHRAHYLNWDERAIIHNGKMSCHKRIMCVCLVAQLSPTVCDPMDCSPSGSSVPGIVQARILEWVVIPFSRGSSPPRNGTRVSCITGRFFTAWATREARKRVRDDILWNCREEISSIWELDQLVQFLTLLPRVCNIQTYGEMREAVLSGQTKAWGWKNEERMYTQ